MGGLRGLLRDKLGCVRWHLVGSGRYSTSIQTVGDGRYDREEYFGDGFARMASGGPHSTSHRGPCWWWCCHTRRTVCVCGVLCCSGSAKVLTDMK